MNSEAISSGQKRPIEWRRAFHAMRRLIQNPQSTDEVFIIIEALAGDALTHGLRRFTDTEMGRQILRERRSLLATLLDREQLARHPDHSLAAHYLSFVTNENISAAGLVEPSESLRSTKNLDEDLMLFANRQRDMHDLWHTLTNYGRDELGEVCLLAFTCAQSPNRGIAFICLVGTYQMSKRFGLKVPRAVYRAYQDGKRAAWLPAQDWESLLTQPIGQVREKLNIRSPQRYQDLHRAAQETLSV